MNSSRAENRGRLLAILGEALKNEPGVEVAFDGVQFCARGPDKERIRELVTGALDAASGIYEYEDIWQESLFKICLDSDRYCFDTFDLVIE